MLSFGQGFLYNLVLGAENWTELDGLLGAGFWTTKMHGVKRAITGKKRLDF